MKLGIARTAVGRVFEESEIRIPIPIIAESKIGPQVRWTESGSRQQLTIFIIKQRFKRAIINKHCHTISQLLLTLQYNILKFSIWDGARTHSIPNFNFTTKFQFVIMGIKVLVLLQKIKFQFPIREWNFSVSNWNLKMWPSCNWTENRLLQTIGLAGIHWIHLPHFFCEKCIFIFFLQNFHFSVETVFRDFRDITNLTLFYRNEAYTNQKKMSPLKFFNFKTSKFKSELKYAIKRLASRQTPTRQIPTHRKI